MKKLLFSILLLSQVVVGQDAFLKGNDFYRKGDFESAVKAYESVLQTKKESAELYYNLGNAYYKLNQVAPSIYNYEKALLLDPNDKDVRNNLEFAQKMQIDEIQPVPKAGFQYVVSQFTSSFHYDTWAWIAIAAAVLFLLLFIAYYFTLSSLHKRIYFGAMWFALVAVLVSVSSAIAARNAFRNERPAIVFAAVTAVRSEPSKDAEEAFTLHEGTKVYVLESLDNWQKVALPDGNQGWLERDAIKQIK